MTPVTPLHNQETILGGLTNALQIARLGAQGYYREGPQTFGDIARLLKNVLEALSEPNFAAMQAGEVLLREWHGQFADRRNLRDTIQGILRAQLEGIVPKTWS